LDIFTNNFKKIQPKLNMDISLSINLDSFDQSINNPLLNQKGPLLLLRCLKSNYFSFIYTSLQIS